MRMAIIALSLVGASFVLCSRNADAVALNATAVKEAASVGSIVQQAHFFGYSTRHYIIKCYHEFVIGPYVCHRFYRWF